MIDDDFSLQVEKAQQRRAAEKHREADAEAQKKELTRRTLTQFADLLEKNGFRSIAVFRTIDEYSSESYGFMKRHTRPITITEHELIGYGWPLGYWTKPYDGECDNYCYIPDVGVLLVNFGKLPENIFTVHEASSHLSKRMIIAPEFMDEFLIPDYALKGDDRGRSWSAYERRSSELVRSDWGAPQPRQQLADFAASLLRPD
ncbi:hypothetical protein [Nocardia salmonicida]|uniref:hypothetical protein n=1 Tax=Nocardia salmonicida TaxID=53431 RepID=UPI0033F1C5F1